MTSPGIARSPPRRNSASSAITASGATETASTIEPGTPTSQGTPAACANVDQPAASAVGEPSSSSRVRGVSRTTGTPGSASSANGVPRANCWITSGANTVAAGTTIVTSRWMRCGCRTMSSASSTTSAGTSTGAEAATAANSRPATAAIDQERRASSTARASQGSSTCATTAPSWPLAIPASSGGAAAQPIAATVGPQPVRATRAAANQAPSAESGIATTTTTTIAKEGDHQVVEPSRASTELNGSAAPR